jgi:hypothetical protein
MELFNRLYQSKFQEVDFDKIPAELQRECFLFNKSILNHTFGDYEYSVMNPYQLQEFINLQTKTGISYTLVDISEKVLMGKYAIGPEYTEELTSFLEEYEKLEKTMDMVLDKINSNRKGIDSLNKIDKAILNG